MVLESIISLEKARRSSWSLFLVGFLYSTIAMILSIEVFPTHASIATIFLTSLAAAPLFVSLLKDEEILTITLDGEAIPIFRNHLDIISIYFFLFFGFAVSFSFWFVFLPDNVISNLFSEQINTINAIGSIVSGNLVNSSTFAIILRNNLRVFFFFFLFSLLYGAGALVILCWNASVLGTAVGLFVKDKIEHMIGVDRFTTYILNLPYGFGQYMGHGVFEILAYVIAGLAGGLLSASIVRKDYKTLRFLKIVKDTSILLVIGIFLVLIGALIEAG